MTVSDSPFASRSSALEGLRVVVSGLTHGPCSLIPEDPDYCVCGLHELKAAADRYIASCWRDEDE